MAQMASRPQPHPIRPTGAAVSALLLAILGLLPAGAQAACDLASFGAGIADTCLRSASECMPAHLPEDLRRIERGAIVEAVGLGPNDGRASWRALDLDRHEVVIVERYAGRKRGQAPHVATGNPHESLKETEGTAGWIDHVRRYPITHGHAEALGCLAARAGAEAALPSRQRSDTASRFYLLLPDRAHAISAMGSFAGAPAELASGIDTVGKRARSAARPG